MKRCSWSLQSFLFLALMAAPGCGDSSNTAATGSAGQGHPVNTAMLAINEVKTTTEDWVEILNVDDVDAYLGGMQLADQDTNGTPRIAEAVIFVDAEKLKPGEYLLVVAGLKTANPGPQATCLMTGGPSRCYQASWGISGANGEQVFLLSPEAKVLDTVLYPANAVLDGQSYCRVPNGEGDFQACTPTPGAANAPL